MNPFFLILRKRLNDIFSIRELRIMSKLTNEWIKKQTFNGNLIEIEGFGTFLAKSAQKTPKMIFFTKRR